MQTEKPVGDSLTKLTFFIIEDGNFKLRIYIYILTLTNAQTLI